MKKNIPVKRDNNRLKSKPKPKVNKSKSAFNGERSVFQPHVEKLSKTADDDMRLQALQRALADPEVRARFESK